MEQTLQHGGIAAVIEKTNVVNIKNCVAQSIEFKEENKNENRGGIVAQIGGVSENKIENVRIENCISNNVEAVENGSSGSGGIAGLIESTNENGKLTINNCITKEYVGGDCKTIGGIVGQIRINDTLIDRCSTIDMNGNGGQSGGIVGISFGQKETWIKDCCVEKFNSNVLNNGVYGNPNAAGVIRNVHK